MESFASTFLYLEKSCLFGRMVLSSFGLRHLNNLCASIFGNSPTLDGVETVAEI